jgi:hypothetical protein
MGRAKLNKPKKDKNRRAAALQQLIDRFDGADVWALVHALGASPNLRARWGSVAAITSAALQADWTANRALTDVSLVKNFLDSTRHRFPELKFIEDYVAADPRLDVRVPINGEVRRLFPGCIERPVADIDRAALTARALDDPLRERYGFGISDVVQVITEHMDEAIEALHTSWPAVVDDMASPTENLTLAELEAARMYLAVEKESSLSSEAEVRALEWLTSDVASLPFDMAAPQSVFGRYARVRRGDATRWLPLAFLPEVLSFAVTELAASVAQVAQARRRFAQESAAAARDQLLRFAPSVLGPLDLPDGPHVTPANAVQWLTQMDGDLVLAVQMISEPGDISIREEPVVKRLADATPSTDVIRVPLPSAELGLPAGADVISLLVTSSPAHITRSPGGPGLASMSLDDLRWISTTATDDLDLALFCRDLADAGNAMTMGLEVIDRWEPWRNSSKAFFTGGSAPDAMIFAPHGGEAEWIRAATLSPVEVAIGTLGLPVLHDMSRIERVGTKAPIVSAWRSEERPRSARIGQTWRDMDAWIVHVGSLPCAIALSDQWPVGDRAMAFDIAGAIPFAIAQVEDAWNIAHNADSARGHVLSLIPARGASSEQYFSVASSRRDDRGVQHTKISVDLESFKSVEGSGDMAVRDELARVMGEAVLRAGGNPEATARMVVAWREAPPTLTVRVIETMTRKNDLAPAIAINESLVSDMDRVVAKKVKDAGVQPGTYFGDEAKALDRDILSKAALEVLSDRLQEYDEKDIVLFGMEQLERTQANRSQRLRSIQQTEQSLVIDWDPVDVAAQTRGEAVQLRRAIETIVEVALRDQPTGTSTVREVAWARLLAAANAYLEATSRSESVHLQVTSLGIQVTELFELKTIDNKLPTSAHQDQAYNLDQHALGVAIAAHDFASQNLPEVADSEWGGVEEAMQAAFGFTATNLFATFLALSRWPLEDGERDVALVARDKVIEHVLEATVLGEDPHGPAKVSAVISSLITTGADLRDAPWTPWRARQRKRRLVAQPIAEVPDGRLVIAPHYLLGTLSMYRNYLLQGVLPWTQPQPPRQLDRALEKLRDAKNKALEEDVATLLKEHGWSVIQNIKETKPSRLNLQQLTTEIDAVAGHPEKQTLLLIEAKDPAAVHSLGHIRDQLNDFYRDSQKKRSYSAQLARKRDDLTGHEPGIASALKLEPQGQPFSIRPIFITRTPVPAAYVDGPFDFMTIEELRQTLANNLLD